MEDEQSVVVHAYDLNKTEIGEETSSLPDGIWFTSIVVYNKEFYFNNKGIESCPPGQTNLGSKRTQNTILEHSVCKKEIHTVFTNDICQFLCSEQLPKYALHFPEENTNRELIEEIINSIAFKSGTLGISYAKKSYLNNSFEFIRTPREPSPDLLEIERQIEELNYCKLNDSVPQEMTFKEKVEIILDKIYPEEYTQCNTNKEETIEIMADERIEETIPQEEAEDVPKKPTKPREPIFEDLVRTIVTLLSAEEQDRLREMEDWIIKNEGTWVLAEGFNAFLGRVLHDKNLPSDGRVALLRLMAYGASQDDIVLLLHMDRKDHLVMNYAQEFDRLPIKEQETIALMFANLFETNSASEWLLYISEWDLGSQALSNIRVTTKVAVNALLGDTPALQNYGAAIMHNLGTKEVFDDVCSELAMAILQYFNGSPSEENIFRCMKGLSKFCAIAHREVPQLVKMIGPEPSKFKGMSARIDELISQINVRLASVPSF
ncbi:DESI1 [Lepeophtheirus salmonis]|uniref:DESI1 n=1 Tax=Lepeophtheirus salmonis TaxID=72036 RepID=A0A7R8GZZ6_LEPSM|nr:DESI1 [Lepeophtheirus salmonis]CAF2760571.1 DESI1 [Lepeophtheirus salmonis]